MKFLVDMGISPRSAAFLRGLGHDAVHLHDEGLDRLSDTNILTAALEEGRVVLTSVTEKEIRIRSLPIGQ